MVALLREKAGGLGETELRAAATNMVSWKGKVWPFAEMPETPTVAGKARVNW